MADARQWNEKQKLNRSFQTSLSTSLSIPRVSPARPLCVAGEWSPSVWVDRHPVNGVNEIAATEFTSVSSRSASSSSSAAA